MRHTYVIAALVLINLAVFGQTVHFDFVDYDDNTYIIDNEHLEGGLTASNVMWGLTTGYFVNWHPVTWWTYLADYSLYGREPGGYHLTNVLIHILATIALYFALLRVTGKQGVAAVIAFLFAVHPQHVQSVAWISERKDVLSGLFMGLTLLAYNEYVRRQRSIWYWITAGIFLFGLMSKSMLVTLPCVLFLLDYWPLNRLDSREAICRAVLEKLPLLGMAVGAAVTTMLLQEGGGAAATAERFGFADRCVNAVHAYGMYILRTFWPVNLSYFYPLDVDNLPYAAAGVSLIALLVITAIAVWLRKREPSVLVGWLWFLGMLVPVIGLMQVGSQASADRYTYIPHVGLFIALVFPLAARVEREQFKARAAVVPSAVVVLVCAVLSWFEAGAWRNTDALTQDALRANPNNYLALYMRGLILAEQGEDEEAQALVRRSVELLPRYMNGHIRLGVIERERGNFEAALSHFSEGLDGHPRAQLKCRLALGETYYELGDLKKAVEHYNEALQLEPENLDAHVGVAQVLIEQGMLDDAKRRLEALAITYPDSYETQYNSGRIASKSGDVDGAREFYLKAFSIDPDRREAVLNLANLQAQSGRLESALILYDRAERASPDDPAVYTNRAAALYAHARYAEALESVRKALELDPESELGQQLLAAIEAEMGARE